MGKILILIVLISVSSITKANVIWLWKFDTESGFILTDGDFSDTQGAASFNILSFQVRNSQFPQNIGANYIETQPVQGFLWDGDVPVEFFRMNGTFTNGSNFFLEGTGFFYGLDAPPFLSQFGVTVFHEGLPVEGLITLKTDTIFLNQFE